MEENRICSFFGHRDVCVTEALYAITAAEIVKSVEDGYRIFYFGGYGDFDALCHLIVSRLREEYADIRRVFCVPQERYLRKGSRCFKREDYEDVIYLTPTFEGWYKSIYFRNCAMIDASDRIIFYAEERADSGAYKAYRYASRCKGRRLVNLWGVLSIEEK